MKNWITIEGRKIIFIPVWYILGTDFNLFKHMQQWFITIPFQQRVHCYRPSFSVRYSMPIYLEVNYLLRIHMLSVDEQIELIHFWKILGHLLGKKRPLAVFALVDGLNHSKNFHFLLFCSEMYMLLLFTIGITKIMATQIDGIFWYLRFLNCCWSKFFFIAWLWFRSGMWADPDLTALYNLQFVIIRPPRDHNFKALSVKELLPAAYFLGGPYNYELHITWRAHLC